MTSALVTPTTHPTRGRSLTATRTILSGELILSDSPLILYPTSLPSPFCSHCLHPIPSSNSNPNPTPCPLNCPSFFCSPLCLTHHSPSLCHSLKSISFPSDPDLLHQSLFLIHAHSLPPTSLSLLLSLHSGPHHPPPHPSLPSLFPPDITSQLLAVDRCNAFGIMAPGREGEERKVRAYGIYPLAALFNHDCLPNACRFDYVDTRGTEIYVRAIHEIAEGREVCLSYFPVKWGYRERQRRLEEEYGFRCECDRCLVERNWKEIDDDDDDDDGGGEDEGMMEEDVNEEEEEEEDDFPHAYFFMKYVCQREECGGTLAPLQPKADGTVSDLLECNVCGRLTKEEDVGGDEEMDDDERTL